MNNKALLVKKIPFYRVLDYREYKESNLKLVHSSRTRLSGLGNIKIDTIMPDSNFVDDVQIEDVKTTETEMKTTYPRDKKLWTLYEIANAPIEGVAFILGPYFQSEAINILTGSSDVGKTNLYQDLGFAIVEEKPELFGEKIYVKHNRVLIVSTEDSIRSLKTRLTKKLRGRKAEKKTHDRFMVLTTSTNIQEQVRDVLTQTPCDLVIIDAFGDAYQGNMNSSNEVRKYLDTFEELIREFKCTILFVHHNVKNSSHKGPNKDKTLGSEGIVSRSRQVVEMSRVARDHSVRTLTITKGNDNSDDIKFTPLTYLRFDSESLTYQVLEKKEIKDLTSARAIEKNSFAEKESPRPGRKSDDQKKCLAIKLKTEGVKQSEIAERVGRSPGTVSKWLSGPKPICNEDDMLREALKKKNS